MSDKMEYSVEMMSNDMFDSADEYTSDGGKFDEKVREQKAKLIVMQMLMNLSGKYDARVYYDDAKLHDELNREITSNEILSGYAFFVAQNPQFGFTWNYMRRKLGSYCELLFNAVKFLRNSLVDINSIVADRVSMQTTVHSVFGDIIDVGLIEEAPFVKVKILWDNFYQIALIGKSYSVVAKVEEVVLGAVERKSEDDFNRLIDTSQAIFNGRQVEFQKA